MGERAGLTVSLVHDILARGQAAAERQGLRVVVAVVDAAGNVAGLSRHPDAFLTSTRVAIGKAFTAANFGASTESLIERIPAETRGEVARADARLVFIGGGVPIGGGGGVGVSGATAAEDAEIAAAALGDVGA